MGDFTGTTQVSASDVALFAYLADVNNLPRYFARMTSAQPGDGEEVITSATLPDGQQVEGRAWFRADRGAQHLEWGSEGPNDYHGHVDVRASGSGSEVEVHLHTTRVEDGDAQVQQGVDQTLATIKQLVEERGEV